MSISRRELLLQTAASASLAAVRVPAALCAPSAAATQRWQLPAKRPFKVIENDWIPMRDGARLAARFWLPQAAETQRVPVVWEYLPYRLWDDLRWRDDKTAENLAPYGVAFVRVDIRGTGNSEGVMTDEYDIPELTDGVEVIAWLARQAWSNGRVGMRGISWGGINALQVAAMRPPELKAIMPMGCVVNRFTDDAHYMGGAYGEENMGWGTSFKGHMAAPPDPKVVGPQWEALWRQRLLATPDIMRTWTSHQNYDAYWKRGSIATDYAAIACPVYVVDGWGDPYENVIGELLENLKVPRKGLIGPWGHIFPNLATPLGLEWQYEEVRWWQQWLGGVETGIMDEPMLRAYMTYKADPEAFPDEVPGRWVAERSWPAARIESRSLYFDAAGRLSPQSRSRERVRYLGDKIVGVTKPQWVYGRPTEFEQSIDDHNSLLFDSQPLEHDLEILGYPLAKVRVSADVPVALLAVRLTEVTPEGKSWLVTYNVLNLTRRRSMEEPSALTPGEFYDVELPLYLIGHRFRKGSRIRVAISSTLWPLVWPSPQIATLHVELGASQLVLPVRPPPIEEAPFTIPVIHEEHAKLAAQGFANGLTWVKSPLAPANLPQMPTRDASGRIRYDREPQPSVTFISAVGTTSTEALKRIIEITEGDPNSCRMMFDRMNRWKRDDWDCTIQFGADLTSTAEEFHLREWVIAKKGDREIFRRETPSIIKRELL
ncbi:MAG TPA: CocE/NonD family hydrolase [Steroidobacteraceae bacterium]|nr:CocE/NonD family hydrolase [Steroidobacteraceae bacterium]